MALLAALTACSSTKHSAPVVERPAAGKPQEVVKPAPTPVPVSSARPDQPGSYTVKKGDTLIRIALDHGQNYRDLVTWNNLANPNDIKVDQVLRVAPPESGLTSGTVAVQAVPQPNLAGNTAQPVAVKTSPLGEKKPYSEAVLAELQKSDTSAKLDPKKGEKVVKSGEGAPVTVVAAVNPSPAPSPSPAPAPAPVPDEERVNWIWPVDGKVIANFEEGKNKGIDIAGKAGQQVLAAGSGKVMYAGSGIRGYGNLVIVKHSNNLLSAYAHNQTILVKEGQAVNRGQVIAEMGSSDSDTVKLHFEIRQQGKPVDPARFLPGRAM